jgi:hypothetical protein
MTQNFTSKPEIGLLVLNKDIGKPVRISTILSFASVLEALSLMVL